MIGKELTATEALQHYKDNGDRVDEVLFHIVTEELKGLREAHELKDMKHRGLVQQLKGKDALIEELHQSLQSACNSLGTDIEDYLPE